MLVARTTACAVTVPRTQVDAPSHVHEMKRLWLYNSVHSFKKLRPPGVAGDVPWPLPPDGICDYVFGAVSAVCMIM